MTASMDLIPDNTSCKSMIKSELQKCRHQKPENHFVNWNDIKYA